ncbi:lipopolysaccharide biosynthesis protein [Endozoicomonadaceae bacterium StTr2]
MSLSNTVIQGLKWGAMLRLAAQIFTWVNTLILIRLLTPDDYGLMAMAMAFIGVFALMGDFGIAKAVIQVEQLNQQLLRQAFTINLLSCLALFLLFFLSAPLIAEFFDEPRVTLLVQAVACQHLILIFHTLPYAMASRKMLFREREKVQFYTVLSSSIFTLVLAALGMGVWALILGHLFMKTVSTIGFIRLQPCWVKPALNFDGFSKMAGFGGTATLNDVLRYGWNVFPNISIGYLMTKVELGVFSVARNLANLPSDKIGELLNHLGLSSFAKLQNEPEQAGKYLIKSTELAAFILFPMYFGMSAVAPELINLTLSEKWLVAIVPFQVLCFSSPLRMLSEIQATAITGMGQPGRNTRILLQSLVMLPVIIYGINVGGVAGACQAWLVITVISFIFHLQQVLPALKVHFLDYLKAVLPSFLAASGMLAAVEYSRIELAPLMPYEWLILPALIAIGVVAFGLLSLMLFPRRIMVMLQYVRR